MSKLPPRGLYALTDASLDSADLFAYTEQILQAGASLIQYRNKQARRQTKQHQAAKLAALCEQFQTPLIINDDVALAAAVGAAGVHLGRDDESIAVARSMLGDKAIIGCSCYDDLNRAEYALIEGADYLAFGAFFPSPSKPRAQRAKPAVISLAKRLFKLPVVAVGGITPDNGAGLIAAGADYLAVISGVYSCAEPQAHARAYVDLFSAID